MRRKAEETQWRLCRSTRSLPTDTETSQCCTLPYKPDCSSHAIAVSPSLPCSLPRKSKRILPTVGANLDELVHELTRRLQKGQSSRQILSMSCRRRCKTFTSRTRSSIRSASRCCRTWTNSLSTTLELVRALVSASRVAVDNCGQQPGTKRSIPLRKLLFSNSSRRIRGRTNSALGGESYCRQR